MPSQSVFPVIYRKQQPHTAYIRLPEHPYPLHKYPEDIRSFLQIRTHSSSLLIFIFQHLLTNILKSSQYFHQLHIICFAIAFAISVETIDSTSTGFSGIELFARFCPRIYSAISIADMFPVNVTYSPLFVSLQYTPRRSASGSVARTRSASFSFASFNASSHASGFSGFGYGAVGKWPSATACCGSMYTFQIPDHSAHA